MQHLQRLRSRSAVIAIIIVGIITTSRDLFTESSHKAGSVVLDIVIFSLAALFVAWVVHRLETRADEANMNRPTDRDRSTSSGDTAPNDVESTISPITSADDAPTSRANNTA